MYCLHWQKHTIISYHNKNITNFIKKYSSKYQENIELYYLDKELNDRYPWLCRLAHTLLIFPHSTADVERLFSQVNLIKTELRVNMKL